MKSNTNAKQQQWILLFIACLSGVFISPKWTLVLAPWIHYAVLLRFYRDSNWKGFLLSVPLLTAATVIAQLEVVPLPLTALVVTMLIGNTIGLLPFVVDRLLHQRLPRAVAHLLFPAVGTVYFYFMDMGPQGTWSNVAYTQFSIKPLMQLTALTGLYGINFLMLWLAAAVNQWYETRSTQQTVSVSLYTMPMVLVLVGIFGVVRLQTSSTPKSTVGVATITMDNLSVHQEMYRATFDKTLEMPEVISQSDPIVVELNKGMMAFMADPQAARYAGVYERMDEVMAKYLDESRKAAAEGAKIITWSEAAIINLKGREEAYTEAVATLADELDIYLFFPTAVFHAEKVGKEELFLENKVLTYGPEGQLLNTYFKNIPVMGVEPSFPGDGTIPVIATPYGQLSPIICYDADHPNLMAQVSNSGTDMLVVPTGDWKAISPYHTYMAAVRCIENGVSMLKATSNGLSALIDDRGRLLEQYDYFDDAPVKRIVAQMPIRSSNTMYATLAPGFIQLLMLLGAGLMVLSIARSNGRRRKPVLQQYPA